MKKRVVCFMLAVLLAIMVFPLGDITAYAAVVEYPVTGGTVFFDSLTGLITGYSGSVTAVSIPKEIDGVMVLGIGESAFESCYSLTEVILPEGIETIGSGAFYYCDNLKSINLPDSVIEIGAGAFYFCRGLESIAIPEGVKTLSAWAFGHCHGLQSIEIPKGVTTIEESAFFSCESLTEIVIPEGVTTIGNAAFSWCRFVTEVTIPEGVITIGDHAFSYCYSLRGVVIPDGVTSLGSSAFSYGYDLMSVTMPDSVVFIGETAFEYCGGGMDLYYGGTEAQWTAISKVNNDFSGVNLHFDNTCEHDYKAVVTEPTCTEDGFTTYTCALCGDVYVDAPVDALGHDHQTVVTEATCVDGGSTVKVCHRCGDREIIEESQALGHAWDDGKITKEPTEESEGVRTFACTRCGEERNEAIPPKDHVHSYSEVTTAPTCTETGYTTYTCPCGDSHRDKETVALGHNYEETVTKPTCTDAGYTTNLCTRCGDTYTGNETAALGHAWDDGKVTEEPTEGKEGVRTFACTRCSATKNEAIPPKEHAHNYTEIVTVPTCTGKGFTTYTCPCGDSYLSDERTALGHDYDEKVTAPTCTESGFTTCTCTRCGESYKDVHTDALKHSYTDGLCIRCGEADPDYEKSGHICPSLGFTDVPAFGDWAHDGIDYCVKYDLMNGTGGNLFNPNGTVSRAQLVTILYRAAGSPEIDSSGTFTDVPAGQWYSNAIEWAAANGVVNGIGGGKFGPDLSITREQIATILYRYEKEPAVTGNLGSFPDHGKIGSFAVNAMIWATNEKLINGVNSGGITTLAPKNNATRAQIASIIMRYLEAE